MIFRVHTEVQLFVDLDIFLLLLMIFSCLDIFVGTLVGTSITTIFTASKKDAPI